MPTVFTPDRIHVRSLLPLLLAVLPLAHAHGDDKLDTVLQQMARTRQEIPRLDLQAVWTREGGASAEKRETFFLHQSTEDGCRRHVRYSNAQNVAGVPAAEHVLRVWDGQVLWEEIAADNVMRVVRRRPESPPCDVPLDVDPHWPQLERLPSGLAARVAGRETFNGQPCIVVEVVPRDDAGGGKIRHRFWLSEKLGVVLRKEARQRDAHIIMEVQHHDPRERLAPHMFLYAPPEGALVTDLVKIDELLSALETARSEVRTLHKVTETTQATRTMTSRTVTELWQEKADAGLKLRRHERTDREHQFADSSNAALEQLAVYDGTHLWMQRQLGVDIEVFKSDTAEPPTGFSLAQIRDRLVGNVARRLPDETVNGHECAVLQIINTQPNAREPDVIYWLSKEHGLLVKTKETVGGGGGKRTLSERVTQAVELAVNEPIDPQRFTYQPPAGVVVADVAKMRAAMKQRIEKARAGTPPEQSPAPDVPLTPLPQTRWIHMSDRLSFSISPDDRWLVFCRNENGRAPGGAVAVLDLQARTLTTETLAAVPYATLTARATAAGWSADSKAFVVPPPGDADDASTPDIAIRLRGTEPAFFVQLHGQPADQGAAAITYDQLAGGRYTCSDCTDTERDWRLIAEHLGAPFGFAPTTQPSRTAAEKLDEVAVSPDGATIYCQKQLGLALGLFARDVAAGRERRIARFDAAQMGQVRRLRHLQVSPDGRYLALLQADDLHVVDLRDGTMHHIARHAAYAPHWTADSQQLVFYKAATRDGWGGEADHLYVLNVQALK